MPLISIIIPVKNGAQTLENWLDGIFSQTLKDKIEVIIIDDGLHIIQQFGLDEFYDENSIPNMNILSRIQNTV